MDRLIPSPSEITSDPQRRARRDLMFFGVVAFLGCLLILSDPHRFFEWITLREQVRVDEFLAAVVVLGLAFAVFSWRRWIDLSRQVAEYKRLQAEMTRINREAAILSETDDLLQSCLTVEEAYRIAIRHFEMQVPQMSGAIFAIAEGGDTADLVCKWGEPHLKGGSFAAQDCWAVRRGRIASTTATDPKPACDHIGPAIPQYALCIPMIAHGETSGIVYLDTGSQMEGVSLSDHEKRGLRRVAEHLSLAVANLTLRETLRIQSIRDPLTGLFNRRYMEESLERELRRSLRKETFLSILMADIDHFKRFNDTFGHEAGDAVLRELARTFQALLRAEDIVCRYGGEEFLVVLPETTPTTAQETAERLRNAVQAIQIQHYGQELNGITLSIGIACYPEHATDTKALVHAADAALYQAKNSGRNRSVLATHS